MRAYASVARQVDCSTHLVASSRRADAAALFRAVRHGTESLRPNTGVVSTR